jgi:hypothetical protein
VFGGVVFSGVVFSGVVSSRSGGTGTARG